MKVLLVTAEATPIVKVGGLGDVVSALAKELNNIGITASIVIPRYRFIPNNRIQRLGKPIRITTGTRKETAHLYRGVLPHTTVPVFFIENTQYLSSGSGPYFSRSAVARTGAETRRFVFFSCAVNEFISRGDLSADIIHCNDWHTGALTALINSVHRTTASTHPKTIFTIHNLANQGTINSKIFDRWMPDFNNQDLFTKHHNTYNLMAEGIEHADHITTVSPTYASEILTVRYGEGLHLLLRRRRSTLTGILNGIDINFFDPARDRFLVRPFTASNAAHGKAINKAFLLSTCSLAPTENAPLFGFVARLTNQKGVDLITKAVPHILARRDARFVFLGRGDKQLEDALKKLAARFPASVSVTIGFNERLAHRIYASSDFFLMPSRFEPCGLGQMISMRYGTVPIVRDTGGLHDTVENLKTGFVFKKETMASVQSAIMIAWSYYTDKQTQFAKIRERCLGIDFGFANVAKHYYSLYKQILKNSHADIDPNIIHFPSDEAYND